MAADTRFWLGRMVNRILSLPSRGLFPPFHRVELAGKLYPRTLANASIGRFDGKGIQEVTGCRVLFIGEDSVDEHKWVLREKLLLRFQSGTALLW